MKLSIIETGKFKLDGGAMFGVVPKTMWSKLNPPDEKNLCTWAMRCLLIETDDRKILVDTGLGGKQDAKFRSHFEPHGSDSLLQSLDSQGIKPEDITDVFLTHLHFDHCGGCISKNTEGGENFGFQMSDVGNASAETQNPNSKFEGDYYPTFPNAIYWTNAQHWEWANRPNPREQASFLKENFTLLETWGMLQFIDNQGLNSVSDSVVAPFSPHIHIHFANGHTEAMMLLRIETAEDTYFYPADLLPSSWHVGLPYVMAYDVRPLDSMQEKEAVLAEAAAKKWRILFEHDPFTPMATVEKLENGRIVVKDRFQNLTDG